MDYFRQLFLPIMVFVFCSGCSTQQKKESELGSKYNSQVGDVSVPFRIHDNRILVDVKVNDKGPYTFLFDTGGSRSNSISPEAAQELELRMQPGEAATGAGSGTQPTWDTEVKNYSVGSLTAYNQKMVVLDLSVIKKAFAFPRLDGIIGFDVLRKAITCIDFDNYILTFKDPGGDCFSNDEKAIIPLRIDRESPMIRGSVNGVETEFFVDTGDRSAFSLFKSFSVTSGIERRFAGKPEVISGYGIGGPIPAKLANIDELKLGSSVILKNVLSRLPLTTGGFFAKSKLGGSIGNEILRRFNIILDYSKSEIRLIKNRHFSDPYQFVPPLTK